MPEFSGPVQHVELSTTLWLIALMPAFGAAFLALFGARIQKLGWANASSRRLHIGSFGVSAVAIGVMVAAFALAVVHVAKLAALPQGSRYLYCHLWRMVRLGSLDVNFDLALDPLSSVLVLVITGVGSLIHIYAAGYMATDRAYWRFFTYLNLFVFSMLLLVLGDGFFVMFFGWEGVGLCSYLLIGFWYQDYKKATAGMKAFVTNRIGDWGFLTGLFLLFWGLGGSWFPGGQYQPDNLPRFTAVQLREADESGGPEARHATHGSGKHAAVRGEHADHEHALGHRKQGHDPANDRVAESQSPSEPGHVGAATDPGALAVHGESESAHGLTGSAAQLGLSGSTVQHSLSGRAAHPGARPPAAQSQADSAYLTMTALPGALVFLDDSPNSLGVAPFVKQPIRPGRHTVRVVAGGAVEDQRLNFVGAVGAEMVMAIVGPTLTFRQLHDQLVMRNGSGRAELRDALMSKTAWGGIGLVTLACIFFFVGATGKSAQIPLYVWLPDAMAGPTPVSALIHAATMVTAGVYMVARLSWLFSLSAAACTVVAAVGALTALFAASIGFFQYDIKKVLAYSTVSQLGFMFIGVGVGAYWAGIFHLTTHAFFKACLFLGSGSVIHGMHAVEHDAEAAQDMRNMGGLRRVMPMTAGTYLIACIAITAAPIPLFAGFWSKDEILWKALNTENIGALPGWAIYAMGLTAAVGTSFYMWRSYYLTFEGDHAKPAIADKVHESPGAMTYVLAVLALLSMFAGAILGFSPHFVGRHGAPLLEHWLEPSIAGAIVSFKERGLGLEYAAMACSVALALAAFLLARKRYGAGRAPNWAARERALPFFQVLHNKYWVDEIYQATFIRWTLRLRLVLADMDRWVVDGLVNGVGVVGRASCWISGAIDHYLVDGLVNRIAQGTLHAGERVRTVQTGRIQSYVYSLLGGVAFLFVVGYLLTK